MNEHLCAHAEVYGGHTEGTKVTKRQPLPSRGSRSSDETAYIHLPSTV